MIVNILNFGALLSVSLSPYNLFHTHTLSLPSSLWLSLYFLASTSDFSLQPPPCSMGGKGEDKQAVQAKAKDESDAAASSLTRTRENNARTTPAQSPARPGITQPLVGVSSAATNALSDRSPQSSSLRARLAALTLDSTKDKNQESTQAATGHTEHSLAQALADQQAAVPAQLRELQRWIQAEIAKQAAKIAKKKTESRPQPVLPSWWRNVVAESLRSELEQQLAFIRDELDRKNRQLAQLQAEMQAKMNRWQDQNTRLEAVEAELVRLCQPRDAKLTELEALVQDIRAKVEAKDAALAPLKQQLMETANQLQTKDRELKAVRQQSIARSTDVIRLESTVRDKQRQLDKNEAETQRLKAQLKDQEGEMTNYKVKLEEKDQALHQAQRQCADAERRAREDRARLEERIRELEECLRRQPETPPRAPFGASSSMATAARNLLPSPQQERLVYVTRTGSRYHSKNYCGNSNPATTVPVPLSEAERRNLLPCLNCMR